MAPESKAAERLMPQDVSAVDVAFGYGDIATLMPPMADIPEAFTRHSNPWVRLFVDWFYLGLDRMTAVPKDGIDKDRALRHIMCVMRSFEPKHEHKTAACAYLLSQWFTRIDYTVNGQSRTAA